MVTAQHEPLHRIFRKDAELFARAMQRVFDVDVPVPDGVTILNTEMTETEPLERRADSVILVQFMIENPDGRYILVVESQTDPDRKKKWSGRTTSPTCATSMSVPSSCWWSAAKLPRQSGHGRG
jgi:hypothetical protein